jgi:hypothetical protein
MNTSRNFICPSTGEPCTDGGCKKDTFCVARQLEKVAELEGEERARQLRIRTGRASADDLGL